MFKNGRKRRGGGEPVDTSKERERKILLFLLVN
jgi:hypothetical protein